MKNIIAYFTAVMALVSLAIPLMAPVAVNAQTASSGFCYTFSQNLGEGRPLSSQDASALTQALTNAGVWSGGAITTYNDAVASAVSGFQEKYTSQILAPYGLSYGTGFIGASTRSELNSLYGCSTPTQPVQSTQCPAGYTCTPINQNPVFSCPSGYTCTPITTAPTQPTITNISNPVTVQVGTLSTTSTTNSTVIQTTIQSLPVAPQILYPVGGEILSSGVPTSISWNPINYSDSFDVSIKGVYTGNVYSIVQNVPAQATDKQSIKWTPNLTNYQKEPSGFVIQVCVSGTNICAQSANSFTIQ